MKTCLNTLLPVQQRWMVVPVTGEPYDRGDGQDRDTARRVCDALNAGSAAGQWMMIEIGEEGE